MNRLLIALCILMLAPQISDTDLEAQPSDDVKKVLFISGRPSHGYGSHEHYAGCMLLAKSLESAMENIDTEVIRHGWPEDDSALDDVDAIVMYSNGGENHPVLPNLDQVDGLAKQGVGIVCIHYAVEVPKGPAGDKFVDWIGGYFETDWSVNPHWKAEFTKMPDHPVSRGVQPFSAQDEWYYHMRFRPEMKSVTPILSAVPPASTLSRPDGPHEGNPYVRATAGELQHVAWAVDREDGGRGFGFTGGHFHWNWGNRNFRRVMLNAIVWTAGADVPEGGVSVDALNMNDLREDQDYDEPADFDGQNIREVHGLDGD